MADARWVIESDFHCGHPVGLMPGSSIRHVRDSTRSAILMAVDDEFGCDYCADDQNRFFGRVEQIASSEAEGSLLLRCPRCASLYETYSPSAASYCSAPIDPA